MLPHHVRARRDLVKSWCVRSKDSRSLDLRVPVKVKKFAGHDGFASRRRVEERESTAPQRRTVSVLELSCRFGLILRVRQDEIWGHHELTRL